MGFGLSKEAFPTRKSEHEPIFQRERGPTDPIYVEDVQDWIDGTDCHVVFIKCVRKAGEEVWGSIPDVKAALDVAEEAMTKYEDAIEEFLDGTEADNEADQETARPVTVATMENLRKVADPMIDSVVALRDAIEKEKQRLIAERKEQDQAFEDGIDDCLFWIVFALGIVMLTVWLLGRAHDAAIQHAEECLSHAGASVEVAPDTAVIEDEL